MDKPLDEGGPGDLKAFAGQMLDDGLHVNTVRKKLNMIRPWYSWAYAAQIITGDQFMLIRTVEDPRGATGKSKPNPYTPDEVREFWHELEAQLPLLPRRGPGSQGMKRWIQGKGPFRNIWRHAMRLQIEAIVRLALDCGLRRSEIYRLTVNDAHYDNEYVVVKGAAKGENFDQDMERHVPITDEARKALYNWIEMRALIRPGHDAMWLTCFGSAWYSNAMSADRFNELLHKVVGPRWGYQRFRHTCGTEWLRAGMPLEIVSAMLGHSSLQQTLAYAEIVGKDIGREVRKAERKFNERLQRRAA